eukprot:11095871-Alexandrium_andersonii.AAC.1
MPARSPGAISTFSRPRRGTAMAPLISPICLPNRPKTSFKPNATPTSRGAALIDTSRRFARACSSAS